MYIDEEKLKQLGITGEPRNINYSDKVDTVCVSCSSSGQAHLNNVIKSLKTKGRGWVCRQCMYGELSDIAKANASIRNPVENIRNNLKSDSIERRVDSYKKSVASRSEEQKKDISEKCRIRALSDNPMSNPDIRQKQWNATHTPEFIERAKILNQERMSLPEYKEISRKTIERRIKENPELVKRSWNAAVEAAAKPEVRAKAVATIRNSPGGYERIQETARATCLAKYGVEFPMQSSVFIDKMMETKTANGTHRVSRAETAFKDWLVSVLPDDTEVVQSAYLSGKQMDVIVPSKKIAFEYNGLFWHTTLCHPNKNYHLEKTLAAEKAGYRLIHVWSDLWNNRRDQYENFILSALGLHDTRLYARKLRFEAIPYILAAEFLDKNHIQGCTRLTCLSIGAFHEDKLLMVATFGRHHRGGKAMVLNRFACEKGVTIVGGLSKASKMASSILDSDLISWADRSLSQGSGYVNAGWIHDETLCPDYFYTNPLIEDSRISKQSRRKSAAGTPANMTENEHALLDGLLPVFDCGKIRFRYIKA